MFEVWSDRFGGHYRAVWDGGSTWNVNGVHIHEKTYFEMKKYAIK